MNDTSIVTVDYHMVPSASLDKRPNQNDRIEQVNVSVVETKALPREFNNLNSLPGAKPTNYVELILTFILCSIGALGFFSYTLSFAHDVLYNSDRFEQVR